MHYNPEPPYNVLATAVISASDMQRVERFARYWDLVANSGRFGRTGPLLMGEGSAFAGFMAFADWLHAGIGQTHNIALERLFDLAHRYLTEARALEEAAVNAGLHQDYAQSGASGRLASMRKGIVAGTSKASVATPSRQRQHLSEAT